MKFFVFLLVIAGSLALGYFVHPSVYSWAEKNRSVVVTQQTIVNSPTPGDPAVPPTPAADGSMPPTPAQTAETAKQNENLASAGSLLDKLRSGDAPAPAPVNPNAAPDEFDKKYPLPQFKEILEITKNWTWMPTKAFPRRVKATQPVVFMIPGGKATMPVGSEIVASALDNGMVSVARNAQDTLTTQVPLAATDLKELMTKLYDAYKTKMVNRVMANRKVARDRKSKGPEPVVAGDERMRLAGRSPEPNAEGQVPEMLASMAAQEITEIKLANIVQWGLIGFERDGSKGYWSCQVTARINTIFGETDSEVTAWMANGKVVKWFYTGSKEPVN